MAFGVLLALVVSSTPTAQAVITGMEAHYHGLAARRSHLAISYIGSYAAVVPSPTRTGDLTFQNPGMMSFMDDGHGFEHVALDAIRYRSLSRHPWVPPFFEEYDRGSSLCNDTPWSHLASIFVGPTSIGASFDFNIVSTSATSTVLVGVPLSPRSYWASIRFELDGNLELTKAQFIQNGGIIGLNIDFGPFVRIPPPGHAAFVLRRP